MKFKPGDLCYIVQKTAKIYPENIGLPVTIVTFLATEYRYHDIVTINAYKVRSNSKNIMTMVGFRSEVCVGEDNLRLISGPSLPSLEYPREKELAR